MNAITDTSNKSQFQRMLDAVTPSRSKTCKMEEATDEKQIALKEKIEAAAKSPSKEALLKTHQDLQRESTSFHSALSNLRLEKDELNLELDALRIERNKLESEIAKLKEPLSELYERVAATSAEIDFHSKLNDLPTKKDDLNLILDELQLGKKKLETEIAKLKETSLGHLSELKGKVVTKYAEIAHQMSELERCQDEIEDYKLDLLDVFDELQASNRKITPHYNAELKAPNLHSQQPKKSDHQANAKKASKQRVLFNHKQNCHKASEPGTYGNEDGKPLSMNPKTSRLEDPRIHGKEKPTSPPVKGICHPPKSILKKTVSIQ